MNGSLSGAWERMGRGSCVPTTGIRQRARSRQALQLNTQRQRAYTWWFFCSLLVWFASVLSLQRKTGSALCWIGSLRRTQPLSAHRPPKHKPSRILFVTSHGYFRQENIREREITLCPEHEKQKGGSRDFFSSSLCRRLSAVAEALRGETHGSLCPKGAVAFWNGFGFFFSLERLLLSPHGCPQFKRSRLRRLSCGLYYLRSRMWNEAVFTRPRKVISWLYLPPR